uniref:Uncharacterized protein n=1 Tax=Amphimedon queenslandica TaxID=400682 RepID=A0A1X7T9Q6_AMPQE
MGVVCNKMASKGVTCKVLWDSKGNLLVEFDNVTVLSKFIGTPPLINSYINIIQYNRIDCTDVSNGFYLEVLKYSTLFINKEEEETNITDNNNNNRQNLVTVTGIVVSVSPVKRNGCHGDMMYFISMKENERLLSIIITAPPLFHYSQYISVGDRAYTITSLKHCLVHKGSVEETRLLSSTVQSQCIPQSESINDNTLLTLKDYGANLLSYT